MKTREKYISSDHLFQQFENEIKLVISKGDLVYALETLQERAKEFGLDEKGILILSSKFHDTKKNFELNLIKIEDFERIYAKTVKGIYSIFHSKRYPYLYTVIGYLPSKKIMIFYFVSTLSLSIPFFYFIGPLQDEFQGDTEYIILQIGNKEISYEKKQDLIKILLAEYQAETTVIVKEGNGNILEKYQLDDFLTRLKYNQFEDFFIERNMKNSITIRYK